MIWTTKHPKTTGFYWAVHNEHTEVEIVFVNTETVLVSRIGYMGMCKLCDFRCWSDYPIHEPLMMAPPKEKPNDN